MKVSIKFLAVLSPKIDDQRLQNESKTLMQILIDIEDKIKYYYRMTHDDGSGQTTIGHLSDSGDLKEYISIILLFKSNC